MAQAINSSSGITSINSGSVAATHPSYQAYQILRLGFTVAPIVAGLDKFFHLLVNWDQYLPSTVNAMTGGHGHQLMLIVGVIEIVAGLVVALAPRFGGYLVAAWLLGIMINLVAVGGYLDRLRCVRTLWRRRHPQCRQHRGIAVRGGGRVRQQPTGNARRRHPVAGAGHCLRTRLRHQRWRRTARSRAGAVALERTTGGRSGRRARIDPAGCLRSGRRRRCGNPGDS